MVRPQNTFKHEEEKIEIKTPKRGFWRNLAEWDFRIDQDFVFRILPYALYVSIFGIVYIANRHNTERMVRQISELREQVEELQVEYRSLQTKHVYLSRRQEIIKKAQKLNLKESKKPHIRITE